MYWVLEQDLDVSAPATVTDIPEQINMFDWMSGQLVKPPPEGLELVLRPGSGDGRGDIIEGVVTLFSEELIKILEDFGIDNVQRFEVLLKDPITHELESGYYLVNIVGLVACVDGGWTDLDFRTRPVSLEKFKVDLDKAQGLPLFRLKESPRLILINDVLRDFLEQNEIVGVRMVKTEDYTVW